MSNQTKLDRNSRYADVVPQFAFDPENLPTYENEVVELVNRLNRQLRRARAVFPEERAQDEHSLWAEYTTNMAYAIDEIQRGPVFSAGQAIRKAGELIAGLESYITRNDPTRK